MKLNPKHKGTLIIVCRLLAETKFLVLYLLSYFSLIKEAQRVLIESTCEDVRDTTTCPQPSSTAFCAEVRECAWDGTTNQPFLGIDPSVQSKHSTFSFVIWFCILAMLNVGSVVALYKSAADGQRKGKSDLAICFKLNELYASKPMRGLRKINFIGFAMSVSSLIISSAIKGALVPMISSQLVAWSAVFTSLMSLHAAEDGLTGIPFKTYRKHLIVADEAAPDGDTDDFAGFKMADLLASAPSVLMAKLSAAALAEEFVELKADRTTSSAGSTSSVTTHQLQQSL